jgi:hypothetical protein
MNCGVCMRYLATVSGSAKQARTVECKGCRPMGKNCAFIKKSCEWLREKKVNFCFECSVFPCRRLETLNRRYTSRYNTSLIDNLLQIRDVGVDRWLEKEAEKWRCLNCGGTVSIHNKKCYGCGAVQKVKPR